MAYRKFEIEDIGPVKIYKKKGVRNVRLSINHDGDIRVSLPFWAPYKLGIEFVNARKEWIIDKTTAPLELRNGMRIGKTHTLHLIPAISGTRISTRVTTTKITVRIPAGTAINDELAQKAIKNACIRALKKQAQQLLPYRLDTLANRHGFTYTGISIKRLKSRWGSCSDKKEIVINCYLMQLPWDLIDYVLIHELMHTRIMAHGPPFWSELERYVPDLKEKRRNIKQHRPSLMAY
jgi:predicted metal-dependent hydrolase